MVPQYFLKNSYLKSSNNPKLFIRSIATRERMEVAGGSNFNKVPSSSCHQCKTFSLGFHRRGRGTIDYSVVARLDLAMKLNHGGATISTSSSTAAPASILEEGSPTKLCILLCIHALKPPLLTPISLKHYSTMMSSLFCTIHLSFSKSSCIFSFFSTLNLV